MTNGSSAVRILSCVLVGIWALTYSPTMAQQTDKTENTIRIATFNASLNRGELGGLLADLEAGNNQQIANVAETIRLIQPDILLINEFDHDPSGNAYTLFEEAYLDSTELPAERWPLDLVYSGPSNTGVPSGLDLDGDGASGGPGDAIGFGFFEGQFAMALFSHLPLADHVPVRTFQNLLWRDLPNADLPDKVPGSGAGDYYTDEALGVLRLSSKSHWDIPLVLPDGRTIHILASHPTPPVFDGPEDRNGKRNADEIRFWSHYLQAGQRSTVLVDDNGQQGGLPPGASFVVMGDLNNDPVKGDGDASAIKELIALPTVQDPRPTSETAGSDTADFSVGRLRVDFVLPSKDLEVAGAGVFWPGQGEDHFHLIGDDGQATSDHRLVWVDITLN